MRFRGERAAFGAPGMEPRWTHSNKQGIGTAYSADTRLWYTIWNGIVTEVYYPLIDHPQMRDLQYLVTTGAGGMREEKRHTSSTVQQLTPHALGYRLVNHDPEGRYTLDKTVIGDPHLPCLLMHTRLDRAPDAEALRLHVLGAPHLELGGWANNARVVQLLDRTVLTAEKGGIWLALGANVPFLRSSVGYVGASDGWTDINEHGQMTWEFDEALNGNVALLGELPVEAHPEFTLGLAFGRSLQGAVSTLSQSLGTPFSVKLERFIEQWDRIRHHERPLGRNATDRGRLYHASHSILLAHEDKVFPGAFIASLSIPWGAAKGDSDRGGYHLVWTRDMVNSATGLVGLGETETALRALIYLATCQQPDGGFPQNFWLDGQPYWQGVQLDEVAYPILLAWRLGMEEALGEFDPYPMVIAAARYLVEQGPVTGQDRWEEVSGYSPSTLAAHIAGLVCAGAFARRREHPSTAAFLEQYADFLERNIERWTVTSHGTLVPGIARHYIRILPASMSDPVEGDGPDTAVIRLLNLAPGSPSEFPAREVVDAGFLELVRHGVRRWDDPTIVDSIRVVDKVLKVDTPSGPVWRRFNHDGYGQREDGGPFEQWGVGRAWPLLTGERGHYEVAAGRDPSPFLEAMEGFATETGLLPEQVWDEDDRPELHLLRGRPTEAATPLAWAHAEYVKLLRSRHDRKVFDQIPEVAERYLPAKRDRPVIEVWKPNRHPTGVRPGSTLRIIGPPGFLLRSSFDGWRTIQDSPSVPSGIGLDFVDLLVPVQGSTAVEFTFRQGNDQWEGTNHSVAVRPDTT